MKSPAIYNCTAGAAERWWLPLEKAGLTVERTGSQAVVRENRAKVFVVPCSEKEPTLMLVYSAPLIFFSKNHRLAEKVQAILLENGVITLEWNSEKG